MGDRVQGRALSLLKEADSVNITSNDLICIMLQIGLSDHNLQHELGAIRNPTLDTFSEKIEGFEQSKRAMSGNAYGHAVTRTNANAGRKTHLINPRTGISRTRIRENVTDASHCGENVLDAHVQIT